MFAAGKMMFARSAAGFDPDAQAYFDRITAAGSSITTANKTAVNDFIVGCKADGIWSAIKASCLLAGPDSLAGALVPLVGVAPTPYNFVEDDYSRTSGLIGDALTKYLNTNRANNADPKDNASMALWITEYPGKAIGAFMSWTNANGTSGRYLAGLNGTIRPRAMCNNGSANATVLHSSSDLVFGFIGVSRNNAVDYYFRYNNITDLVAKLSDTLTNSGAITVFRQGNNASAFSDPRISFYSIGEALDLALLDARLTTYMAALT
jgi:hypothetical protein